MKKMENKTEMFESCLEIIQKINDKILMRCLLEGCRYGYYEDEIQDYCIYCGKAKEANSMTEAISKFTDLRQLFKQKE